MTTIGFIGAGHIGGTLAQLAIDHGYDVVVSNSRGPETLTDLVQQLGDRARAATSAEAAAAGDIVVVTIPTKNVPDVPVAAPRRQGRHRHQQLLPAARRPDRGPRRRVDHRLRAAAEPPARRRTWSRRSTTSRPPTSPRRASPRARRTAARSRSRATTPTPRPTVAALIDELGFDVVDVGALAEGWRCRARPARVRAAGTTPTACAPRWRRRSATATAEPLRARRRPRRALAPASRRAARAPGSRGRRPPGARPCGARAGSTARRAWPGRGTRERTRSC